MKEYTVYLTHEELTILRCVIGECSKAPDVLFYIYSLLGCLTQLSSYNDYNNVVSNDNHGYRNTIVFNNENNKGIYRIS